MKELITKQSEFPFNVNGLLPLIFLFFSILDFEVSDIDYLSLLDKK